MYYTQKKVLQVGYAGSYMADDYSVLLVKTIYSSSSGDNEFKIYCLVLFMYNLFHKTLPKSSLEMLWISVRFYEMGDS